MFVLPEFNCWAINFACKYACLATEEVPAKIVEQAIQIQALKKKKTTNKPFDYLLTQALQIQTIFQKGERHVDCQTKYKNK